MNRLAYQHHVAERLQRPQVGSQLVVLKPVRWFANPDFGHDSTGWRRTSIFSVVGLGSVGRSTWPVQRRRISCVEGR